MANSAMMTVSIICLLRSLQLSPFIPEIAALISGKDYTQLLSGDAGN